MKITARNSLQGTVKQITPGAANAEVVIEVAPGVEVISVITKAFRESLGPEVSKEVYTVIKASTVMLALD